MIYAAAALAFQGRHSSVESRLESLKKLVFSRRHEVLSAPPHFRAGAIFLLRFVVADSLCRANERTKELKRGEERDRTDAEERTKQLATVFLPTHPHPPLFLLSSAQHAPGHRN